LGGRRLRRGLEAERGCGVSGGRAALGAVGPPLPVPLEPAGPSGDAVRVDPGLRDVALYAVVVRGAVAAERADLRVLSAQAGAARREFRLWAGGGRDHGERGAAAVRGGAVEGLLPGRV